MVCSKALTRATLASAAPRDSGRRRCTSSEERAPYDPMPHGPPEVGVGPVGGSVARGDAVGSRAAARRRSPQRGRPLPLLDGGGDRRRPRHPPARLPRRDRELAARLQHRHDRAHRQRLPRRRGAHRRQPPLEPARRDGDRPLPARPPPPGRRQRWRRTSTRLPEQDGAGAAAGHRQPARLAAPRDDGAAAAGVLPLRAGGTGALGVGARGVRRHLLHRPVRLDPLDQRQLGRRDRDAQLGRGTHADLAGAGAGAAEAPRTTPTGPRADPPRRPGHALGSLPRCRSPRCMST